VSDDRLGEVPVAFVVGRFQPDVLEARAREHLAPYKVPVRFEPVDTLPRNEIGKVLTGELPKKVE
jgi:long-chain acyl-CoA synthetase